LGTIDNYFNKSKNPFNDKFLKDRIYSINEKDESYTILYSRPDYIYALKTMQYLSVCNIKYYCDLVGNYNGDTWYDFIFKCIRKSKHVIILDPYPFRTKMFNYEIDLVKILNKDYTIIKTINLSFENLIYLLINKNVVSKVFKNELLEYLNRNNCVLENNS